MQDKENSILQIIDDKIRIKYVIYIYLYRKKNFEQLISSKKTNENDYTLTYGIISKKKQITDNLLKVVIGVNKNDNEEGLYMCAFKRSNNNILYYESEKAFSYKNKTKEIYYFLFMYLYCEILIINFTYSVILNKNII